MLHFNNRTFAEFFEENFQINIYADAFSEHGTSKYNRLRAFIEIAPAHNILRLLNMFWTIRNEERDAELQRAESLVGIDPINAESLEFAKRAAALEDSELEQLLSEIGNTSVGVAVPDLEIRSDEWNLDTVAEDIRRAKRDIDADPEGALTAACSMLESVMRSIILARNIELPKRIDIQSLYKAVRSPLGLSPSKKGLSAEIEDDVRAILAALGNTAAGIGSLRSHSSSAHGRERGRRRVDSRIARLAVNAASTLALFLVETWEGLYPEDRIVIRSDIDS